MIPDPDYVDAALRQAYADLAATIGPDEADPGRPVTAGQPERQHQPGLRHTRWLGPAAIAAAVALITVTAAVVPRALESGSGRAPVPAAAPPMAYLATEEDTVIPVDLSTGAALAAIRLGVKGSVAGALMTPDRKTLYVATVRGQVTPVDLETRRAGRPISIGGVPQAMVMTPDGRTAYVLEPPYGVAVVNLAAGKPAGFIKVAKAFTFALTPDGATLYVAGTDSRVTPVDTASGRARRPIAIRAMSSWVPLMAMNPDGRTVYVAGQQAGSASATRVSVLTPITTRTGTAGEPIRLGPGLVNAPIAVSPDGRTAYVNTDGTILPVSLGTDTVGTALRLPDSQPFPYLLTISPDSSTIYAISGQTNYLDKISAAAGSTSARIQLGPSGQWYPTVVAFGPAGRTVYVLSYAEQTRQKVYLGLLTLVDAATGKAGKSVLLRGVPAAIAFRP